MIDVPSWFVLAVGVGMYWVLVWLGWRAIKYKERMEKQDREKQNPSA